MTLIREISLNNKFETNFQKDQFKTAEIGTIKLVENKHKEEIVNQPEKLTVTNKEEVVQKTGMSKEFVENLMAFEGLRLKTYSDSGNVKTIGWGHNIEHDTNYPYGKNDITIEQAHDLLAKDIIKAQDDLKSCIGDVQLSKGQYEALVDMFFNVGIEKLENTNLMKAIKEKRFDDAVCEFNFVCVKGKVDPALCRRRIDNIDKFSDKGHTLKSVDSMQTIQNKGIEAFDKKIAQTKDSKKGYYTQQKKVYLNITNPVIKAAEIEAHERAARGVFDLQTLKPIEKQIPNLFITRPIIN